MAVCPICAAPVPDDFGLIECSKCGAPLLVHMDGRVEHSGAEVPDPVITAKITLEPSELPMSEPFEFPAEVEPEREIALDPSADTEPTLMAELPELAADGLDDKTEELPPPPPLAAAVADNEPEGTFNFSEPSAEEINAAPPVYTMAGGTSVDAASPDLSDIARFGNSDASGAPEGSLKYKLFITGIDTADVREAFREAITDRKMMWDTDEILRSIRNGEVQIQNLSPVKAYILVARLRSLPVRINWEQNAIAEA